MKCSTLYLLSPPRKNIIVGKCRNGKILLRPVTEDDGRLFLRTAERNGYTYFTVSETENSALSPDEIENVITKKLAFYDGLPKVNIKDANTEKMFYKCVSVMKSQVYTPSGIFSHRWTTPNKVPHRVLWLWDSVFHSLGNYYISPSLARETLFAVLDTQRSDGFVPHMGSPTEISSVTQPPVLAYGFLRLYEKTGDRQMLAEVYPRLSAYLDWNTKNRTDAENGLYVWHVDISSTHCRCDESGMDNSPRFDDVRDMDCIDFSCYMKHEAEIMAKIAEIIGAGDAERWRTLSEKVSHAIKTVLWDENDGFFYDRIIESGKFRKKKSVASFLTLFAGACTKEQAALLVSELLSRYRAFPRMTRHSEPICGAVPSGYAATILLPRGCGVTDTKKKRTNLSEKQSKSSPKTTFVTELHTNFTTRCVRKVRAR